MQILNGKSTGDSLTAAEWNQLPTELQNIITGTNQTPTSGDLNQVGKGIAAYTGVSDFYLSSGPADAYVLTPLTGFQAPTEYFDGMRVRFIPNVANSGGSVTVNVNGLGVRTVVREDGLGNSSDTEYQVGVMVDLWFDDSANNFKLRRIPNAGMGANEYGLGRIATQTDVNTGSSTFLTVTPSTLNGKTATESRRGVIEIATQPETETGTDDTRAITPLKLETRLGLLGSDNITNNSGVAGATVSAALDTLDGALGTILLSNMITTEIDIPNSTPVDYLAVTLDANTNYAYYGELIVDGQETNTGTYQLICSTNTLDASMKIMQRGLNPGDNTHTYNNWTTVSGIGPSITVDNADVAGATNQLFTISGHIRMDGSSGSVEMRSTNQTATSDISIKVGSHIVFTPI